LASILGRKAGFFLPIVLSSPGRELSELKTDGQKKKNAL